ncbi:LysR family transcriptional regulator [Candidatus Gracilibacteria bacterium]|nr:LysR family transcriptional regulator [Candidatus Gracilibacteria bacterium]
MVDYDWYRSFLVIYRVGTVTGAAEERGLTQPALTQHLAGLEAVVGEPLFTRTARRMLPTERGKALYTQVVGAIEVLDRVSLALRRSTTSLPEVRLGTPREYFSALALRQLTPLPLRLWTQFGIARVLLEALRVGDLDLVIATERLNLREIEYRTLFKEEFVLVASLALVPPLAQPETAAQRALLAEWALSQPWVAYARDLPIIRRFWRQCFGARPTIEPHLIIPDLAVLAQTVSLGYLSVLPAYLCAEQVLSGHLNCLWAPDPPVTNDLWLAYRTRDRQRPEVQRAVDALLRAH